MPEHWTVPRIANRMHRTVLEPLGFQRRGNTCFRSDGGLDRSLKFYGLPADPPKVQLLAIVQVAGLPERALSETRYDSLWGAPAHFYPRPRSTEDLPGALVADVAGPAAEFLVHADGLAEFVLWAQEIFLGDGHRGWWRRFQPVFPQGTGPLQAAAYAAAKMADERLTDFLARRVANEEGDQFALERFRTELARLTVPHAAGPL